MSATHDRAGWLRRDAERAGFLVALCLGFTPAMADDPIFRPMEQFEIKPLVARDLGQFFGQVCGTYFGQPDAQRAYLASEGFADRSREGGSNPSHFAGDHGTVFVRIFQEDLAPSRMTSCRVEMIFDVTEARWQYLAAAFGVGDCAQDGILSCSRVEPGATGCRLFEITFLKDRRLVVTRADFPPERCTQ